VRGAAEKAHVAPMCGQRKKTQGNTAAQRRKIPPQREKSSRSGGASIAFG